MLESCVSKNAEIWLYFRPIPTKLSEVRACLKFRLKSYPICCQGTLRWAKNNIFCVKINCLRQKSCFFFKNHIFASKITFLASLRVCWFPREAPIASRSRRNLYKTTSHEAHCVTGRPKSQEKPPLKHLRWLLLLLQLLLLLKHQIQIPRFAREKSALKWVGVPPPI